MSKWPEPDKITVAWWRNRVRQLAPKTAVVRRSLLCQVLLFLEREKQSKHLKTVKIAQVPDSVTVEGLYTREELERVFAIADNTTDRIISGSL